MGWREQLREASFRGVTFKVESHSFAFGRKQQVHEYTERDLPFPEDLGRRPREFTIEAFILGPDYFADRDALIEACEKKGPGTLIHPYLGTRTVAFTGGRLRESARDGGIALFSLSFVNAGEQRFPEAVQDSSAEVAAKSDSAIDAVLADFGTVFKSLSNPAFVAQEASTIVTDFADEARAALVMLVPDAQKTADFIADVDDLKQNVATVVQTPSTLGSRISTVVKSLAALAEKPEAAYQASRELSDFGSSLATVIEVTTTRTQQAKNQDALVSLVRRSAIIEMARASAQIAFEHRDQALEVRDEVAEKLDAEILAAGDAGEDQAVDELSDLYAAVVRDIAARGANLVRLVGHTPSVTLPALVIAYQLYGDAGRADEIVQRNRVRHPGFVPGGTELQVLSAA